MKGRKKKKQKEATELKDENMKNIEMTNVLGEMREDERKKKRMENNINKRALLVGKIRVDINKY